MLAIHSHHLLFPPELLVWLDRNLKDEDVELNEPPDWDPGILSPRMFRGSVNAL